MEYLMFVCTDADTDTDKAAEPDIEEWLAEGDRRGIRKQGDRLVVPKEARTIRVRNGETLVTDGPFAETKEWIAGYDLLECKDLDEAVEYASRHPMARAGRIEIRAIWPWEG
ncbi:MAG TPA: YciI family protein [Galbitalea sp.]|nr:YciI family protein [Galbitalea sp.]